MTCRHIDRKAENRPKRPPEARKSDKNTANTQQVRFFKLDFDFNVFSAENRRLFSIEFQLHTNSHITLWLPVNKLQYKTHLCFSPLFVFSNGSIFLVASKNLGEPSRFCLARNFFPIPSVL